MEYGHVRRIVGLVQPCTRANIFVLVIQQLLSLQRLLLHHLSRHVIAWTREVLRRRATLRARRNDLLTGLNVIHISVLDGWQWHVVHVHVRSL